MAADDRLIDGCTYRAAIIRNESGVGARDSLDLCHRNHVKHFGTTVAPNNVQANETRQVETQ